MLAGCSFDLYVVLAGQVDTQTCMVTQCVWIIVVVVVVVVVVMVVVVVVVIVIAVVVLSCTFV